MTKNTKLLIDKLEKNHSLSLPEYEQLIVGISPEATDYIGKKALKAKKSVYGNDIYIRGLIEVTNFCKNNCFYCGIRRDNSGCSRYRLTKDEILSCADKGYELGFRTFVLQGGEDMFFTDRVLCDIISSIKKNHPNCAVTLSFGERDKESYQRLFSAGADRYLLRHETADKEHYIKLHPPEMEFENRINCLKNLREIGYATGMGFMVGSPYQTPETLAEDLKLIETFSPEMCGIGPFIPHAATPFKNFEKGDTELTLYLLSAIRLIKPNILLPATTALSTVAENGREKGFLAGANVVMPNLSPQNVRAKYELYNKKLYSGEEAAEQLLKLKEKISALGFNIAVNRGDIKNI